MSVMTRFSVCSKYEPMGLLKQWHTARIASNIATSGMESTHRCQLVTVRYLEVTVFKTLSNCSLIIQHAVGLNYWLTSVWL